MFILGIQGSPRGGKSRTRLLLEWVLSGARDAGATVYLVNITDYKIIPCTGCEICMKTGVCVYNDDFPEPFSLLQNADGVVFGSPVYIDQVSGQMKIFIDRLADAMHTQVLGGRYGCSVATTFNSGGPEVVAYLDHVINYLGAIAIEGMSLPLGEDPGAIGRAEPDARDLGKRLVQAIHDKPGDPFQQLDIEDNRRFFQAIVEDNKENRPDEYARWVRMGWISPNGHHDE